MFEGKQNELNFLEPAFSAAGDAGLLFSICCPTSLLTNTTIKRCSDTRQSMKTGLSLLPKERIEQRIFFLRGEKVMLSTDLARLYQVDSRVLVQAVKRNAERFPEDFMFQLTAEEFRILKSQIVISSWGGIRRATPYAFTEQGIAMLSSVLKSRRAVRVNIEIMRTFVGLRRILASNEKLTRMLAALEDKYDAQFKVVFDAIRQLMRPPEKTKRQIGFKVEEPKTSYRTKRS